METRNTVVPADFARRMKSRWETTLANTSSPALESLWGIMAKTFNAAIAGHANGDTTWRVLQPPTGTGKTQGLSLYGAMMADLNAKTDPDSRTGILAVTRTIQQAEEIVETTNAMGGREVAVARHSGNSIGITDSFSRDVLVITHAAYQLAMEAVYRGRNSKLPQFLEWQGGQRCLTIIDEAIGNIVEQYQVGSQRLRWVLGLIDRQMEARHQEEVTALRLLLDILDRLAEDSAFREKIAWEVATDYGISWDAERSLGVLSEELCCLPLEQIALGRTSSADRQRLSGLVRETLQACQKLLTKWAYFNQSGHWASLNSAQLLVPVDLPGPVVLDATASQNMLWDLLGDRTVRPSVPSAQARNYRNVTLHVAYAKGLGKESMKNKGDVRVERVLKSLEETHADRSVLLCCHQAVEGKARTLAPSFRRYDVAHWNAIDGKNDWQDFDTVVILGLPFRGQLWATSTFFALQGLRDDEWLSSPSWGQYSNIRETMETQQIIVSAVQAINRVQCRKVINGEGDCPRADVFIVLPKSQRGRAIIDGICSEMPGIKYQNWDMEVDGDKVSVQRAEGYQAIIPYMEAMASGEYPVGDIGRELGWDKGKVKELRRTLGDPEHVVTSALARSGVVYHHNGKKGGGARSWLIKA